MRDGARPHTANVVLDFLHDMFDSRVISNQFPDRFACGQNWPPNSPDLNPCDNFLWGFLKEKVFFNPQTIMELMIIIFWEMTPSGSYKNQYGIERTNHSGPQGITEDMCRRVINITVLIEEVARRNGGRVEHLFPGGKISMQWCFFLYVSF
jgi:hypothetical protein